MTDLQKAQCEKILDTYGVVPQLDMLVEECSELIQAACKLTRTEIGAEAAAKDNLREEIADVLIMIEQIKYGLKLTDLDVIIGSKIDRQLRRIGGIT